MDGRSEFAIPSDKLKTVTEYVDRIYKLFGVTVEPQKDSDLTELGQHSLAKQTVWLTICSSDGADRGKRCMAARDYIKSLTAMREPQVREYTHSQYTQLVKQHDHIERQSSAVLFFNNALKTITIKGHDDNVVNNAESLIKVYCQSVLSSVSSDIGKYFVNSTDSDNTKCSVESKDSCFQSGSSTDYFTSPYDSSVEHSNDHELAFFGQQSTTTSSLHHSDSSDSEFTEEYPGYSSKVEFALKRGYSKEQLKQALKKCGANVSQNDLLSQLITIGSLEPKTQDVEWTEYDSVLEEDSVQVLCRSILAKDDTSNLRPIVIDGSNVAMSHGNKEVFSCMGLKIVVDWFKKRGHQSINAFVPQWRKEASRPITPISDQEILTQLEKEGILTFTPSRRIGGKRVVCYDDRYIIKLAAETDAIVVSNDNYRDLLNESPEYRKVIEERLLMFCFVNNNFMPPDDPLGRNGPSLENFLRKEPTFPEPVPSLCPYGKKCTYGNKCKYSHPERGLRPQKSVTETIQEVSRLRIQEIKDKNMKKSQKVDCSNKPPNAKRLLARTISLNPHANNGNSPPPPLPPKNYNSSDVKLKAKSAETVHWVEDQSDIGKKTRTLYVDRIPPKVSLSNEVPHNNEWGLLGVQNILRQTHSDPNRLYSDGGHLSVAKKLSDEGCQAPLAPAEEQSDSLRQRGLPDKPQSKEGGEFNVHRKLHRQLTLEGSEDPRVQQHHSALYSGMSSNSTVPQPTGGEGQNPGYQYNDPYPSYPEYGSLMTDKMYSYPMQQTPAFDHVQRQRTTAVRGSWPDVAANQQTHNLTQRGGQSRLVERSTLPYPEGDMNSRNSWPTEHIYTPNAAPTYTTPFHNVPYYQREPPPVLRVRQSFYRPTYSPIPNYPTETYPVTYSSLEERPRTTFHTPQPPAPTNLLSPPSFEESAPILPQDPRYNMYYHLSGVFPEEKVRKVMNRFPEERNPQHICKHIISMQ